METNYDVLIVGAGAAGLAAARVIAAAGLSVAVLEARDRIGGRVWTDTIHMSVPVEMGAELIHGDDEDNSLWPLVRANAIPTHALQGVMTRLSADHPWLRYDDPRIHHFPLGQPVVMRGALAASAGETAQTYLGRLGIAPENYPLSLHLMGIDGEQFARMPADKIEQDIRQLLRTGRGPAPQEETDGRDHRVIGGYEQVLSVLARDLTIHLETIVEAISDQGDKVEVRAVQRGESMRFTACCCVMAVPAGVLLHGDIVFSPPLPDEKISALRQGHELPVAKILMEFAKPILPEGAIEFSDFSRNPPLLWNGSAGLPDYDGQIVVGWATGDRARDLLALPKPERFDSVLDAVRNISGQHDLTYIHAAMHDWTSDVFSRGAYGWWFGHEADIYRPTGNIHWAGMIMPRVDRAFDTGMDAGEQVLASLSGNG